ncbi:MAG: hypothetical protein CMJ64_17755 [Planctomycetaceae bacterium]|jgi:hypothetical protein|nr:hypothetical protein [Planctomycetaceae bacterium]
MKQFVVIGIGTLAMAAAFVGYRVCYQRQEESPAIQDQAINSDDSSEWIPSEAELANGNQGVGWVFGRMTGVADSPGGPNHSPFGNATHSPKFRGAAPHMR